MKRLMWLAVLFVVLSVCVPSYGYFLIYNVSGSVKGVNNIVPASIAWKGYLVLNLDDTTDDFVDANLIMYGKDSDKKKVYVVLNYNSNEYLDVDTWWQGDFMVFSFWGSDVFDFEGLLLGKEALKDIGFGTSDKRWIVSSMKGNMMVWNDMLFDAGDDIAGTGNVSASLYTAATKYVNDNGWTQDEIMNGNGSDDGLIHLVEDKGYDPAVLP